ncbi:MAG: sigma-70 family RNA polymerase sigma factor [Bacteroidales bacterium]|nr:sigma-70 family RNA polymerase sigma factor [Bacteroidales bacterium]
MQNEEHPFLTMTQQHAALIDKICRSFCNGDAEDANDLRQDILLNLWRGWKRWKPYHKPITWVWRVAMNTAISWRRARQRRIEMVPIENSDMPEDRGNQDAISNLYSLISRLPAPDQRLLQLYIDGWTGQEIAVMLQTSASNITTRIGRIKEKLRDLEQQENHE